MSSEVDIKKLSMEELYRRAQLLDRNISIEHRRRSSTNSGTIELLKHYKQEIVDELRERYYTSNTKAPFNGNLTSDSLAEKEVKDDRPRK